MGRLLIRAAISIEVATGVLSILLQFQGVLILIGALIESDLLFTNSSQE